MLDKIKKYAPKTHDVVLKIVTVKQNAEKKFADYEQRIQQMDKEIAELEVKSIKDPSNTSLNDKLEDLSAKRYGLKSRYESIKNNELNLFSKAEIDKLFEVFSKEYKEKISTRRQEIAHGYQTLSEDRNQKVNELEEVYAEKRRVLLNDEYALADITEVLSQTLTKYLLAQNMSMKEIEKLMVESGLPFGSKTERSL